MTPASRDGPPITHSNQKNKTLQGQNALTAMSAENGRPPSPLQRLGLAGALYRTLRSTNAIENLNGSIATYARNVKRWRDGQMVLRWVGAALHEASAHFRRVRGYRDLPILIAALAKLDKETQKAA